jgi:hypothetical protein
MIYSPSLNHMEWYFSFHLKTVSKSWTLATEKVVLFTDGPNTKPRWELLITKTGFESHSLTRLFLLLLLRPRSWDPDFWLRYLLVFYASKPFSDHFGTKKSSCLSDWCLVKKPLPLIEIYAVAQGSIQHGRWWPDPRLAERIPCTIDEKSFVTKILQMRPRKLFCHNDAKLK